MFHQLAYIRFAYISKEATEGRNRAVVIITNWVLSDDNF